MADLKGTVVPITERMFRFTGARKRRQYGETCRRTAASRLGWMVRLFKQLAQSLGQSRYARITISSCPRSERPLPARSSDAPWPLWLAADAPSPSPAPSDGPGYRTGQARNERVNARDASRRPACQSSNPRLLSSMRWRVTDWAPDS